MKIAIGGKGGSGKTTFAGTLARALAQESCEVLAIDGDSNPNLGVTLGLAPTAAFALEPLPRDLLVDATDEAGTRRRVLGTSPPEVIDQYSIEAPDGVRLIVGGRVGHAGTGCMCGSHARVRTLLNELIEGDLGARYVIVDLEAGLENFSRGTPRAVDAVIAVIEPFYRSMETAARVCELARELGVRRIWAVANRIRTDEEFDAVTAFCAGREIDLIGRIPFDPALLDADRAGKAPIDHDAGSPAVAEVRRITATLIDKAHSAQSGSDEVSAS